MVFPIYDYRSDQRNVVVTPQIRSRFLSLQPTKNTGNGHTHDVGHEVFIVMEGEVTFEIGEDVAVLSKGQMCVAMAGIMHNVYVSGNEPAIIYLSVTPHVQPTHTTWDSEGNKLPPMFQPVGNYDEPVDQTELDSLIDRYIQTIGRIGEIDTDKHCKLVEGLKMALISRDNIATNQARNDMWQDISIIYQQIITLTDIWNVLTARSVDIASD